jgi:hypothetical protein
MAENLTLIVLLALVAVGASGALLGMGWYELASRRRYKDEKCHG